MNAIIHAGLLFIALTIMSARPATSGVFEVEATSVSRKGCVVAPPGPRSLAEPNSGRELHPGRPEALLPCAEAMALYRQAAVLGDRVAQNNLGVIYEEGHGTTQNYEEATNWYRKAAEQGDAVAQSNLALMYLYGRGVAQNFIFAHMWTSLATSGGDSRGACLRDVVAQMMSLADIAKAQSLVEEWKLQRRK